METQERKGKGKKGRRKRTRKKGRKKEERNKFKKKRKRKERRKETGKKGRERAAGRRKTKTIKETKIYKKLQGHCAWSQERESAKYLLAKKMKCDGAAEKMEGAHSGRNPAKEQVLSVK